MLNNNNFNPMMNNMNQNMIINPMMNNMNPNMVINPMMNNMNPNMVINPMMNNMNPNMIINPMMNNMNQNMVINPMMNNMNPNMVINPMMNNMNPNMIINPMMNNMNQNMNQMNMMMGNINQPMDKEIKVIVISENKIDVVSCFENDSVDTLKNKLKELNFNEGDLIHNYRALISTNLNLRDYGISNGSIIYIKSNVINVIFLTTNGIRTAIPLDGDCPLRMAIIIYGFLSQTKNFFQMIKNNEIVFLFNATKLRINDETPIKIVFENSDKPKVIVDDRTSLRGG